MVWLYNEKKKRHTLVDDYAYFDETGHFPSQEMLAFNPWQNSRKKRKK